MNYRIPVHPGELLAETLELREVSAYRVSQATGISQTALSQILRGKRGITATTALLLGQFFGTSPEFWLNLQAAYDLDAARVELGEKINVIEVLALPA